MGGFSRKIMCNVLVVEDEIFVAIEIESVVAELGYRPIGIAGDRKSAMGLAGQAEVALVDLNLRDGPTGRDIGRTLAEDYGVTVVYMTANPSQLGAGVPGTVGVIAKPVMDEELKQTVRYAVAVRHNDPAEMPRRLRLFANGNVPPPARRAV
jgi:CheY-like chemotaxis protein